MTMIFVATLLNGCAAMPSTAALTGLVSAAVPAASGMHITVNIASRSVTTNCMCKVCAK